MAGGAVAGLLTSEEAAATTGTMQYGNSQDSGTAQTNLSSVADVAFGVLGGNFDGVTIFASGVKRATAVSAEVTFADVGAVAVRADIGGTLGFPIVANGGEAQLFLVRYLEEGFITKPNPSGGQIVANLTGLYYCVKNGPEAPDFCWWTLASRDSAGSLYPISPSRVYDSRVLDGPLASGAARTVFVGARITPPIVETVPKGARAIAYNLTVAGTVGGFGFLAVNEGGSTSADTSAINWTASGLSIANASVVKISADREITVVCGGPGAATHFIIDVVGFYK